MDHVAIRVELDDRRRSYGFLRLTRHALGRDQTTRLETAGENEDVILRVDTGAADLTRHPIIGKRLWPERVDPEFRGLNRLRRISLRSRSPQAAANGYGQC